MRTRFASLSLLVLVVALALTAVGCSRDKTPSARLGLGSDGKPSASSTTPGSAEGGSNETTDSPKKPSATSPASGGSQANGQSGSSSGGSNSGNTSGGTKPGGTKPGTKPGGTKPGGNSDPATPQAPEAAGKTIRILWWNDTVDKPVASPEIVYGGKSYKPASGKSDVGAIGPAKPGDQLTFSVYPNGRSGKSVSVAFEVTDEMLSNSDVDAIHVEVSDAQVRVLGNPIPNFVQAFSR